jgi:hypothetical protein
MRTIFFNAAVGVLALAASGAVSAQAKDSFSDLLRTVQCVENPSPECLARLERDRAAEEEARAKAAATRSEAAAKLGREAGFIQLGDTQDYVRMHGATRSAPTRRYHGTVSRNGGGTAAAQLCTSETVELIAFTVDRPRGGPEAALIFCPD